MLQVIGFCKVSSTIKSHFCIPGWEKNFKMDLKARQCENELSQDWVHCQALVVAVLDL
jgi:hypothetical protein